MFSTILFALVAQSAQLSCPIMGGSIAADSTVVEYAGAQFKFCCPGCDAVFKKDPAKAIAEAVKKKETVGVFLFDPVSRNRLDIAKAKATLDHNGIRFPFESTANRDKFRAASARYASVPGKEALFCPVMQSKVASISKAAGYVDHGGVRYYTCCAGCNAPLAKEPSKYAPNAARHVKTVGAHQGVSGKAEEPVTEVTEITSVTAGKYKIELLVPEDGVFAGEEIDIEFVIVDTTKEDPDLGFLGVANLRSSAVVTMPSMPGMPEAKPNIHREGIPGYYGIELFFPHGGDYRIDLTLTPPGEQSFDIHFLIDVKDAEARTGEPRPKPFTLSVIDGAKPQAGTPFDLRLKVHETKTSGVVTKFEIVHEERFHLLIASEDFGWFLHEHPTMNEDGVWTQNLTFPAGGKYFIYGDVAPVGKGSQILIAEVNVAGTPFPAAAPWAPTLGPSRDGQTVGTLGFVDGEPPIGRMTTLSVKLIDSGTGQPITDLQQWLGAWGHLMIFSQDGMTVVHSHPAENEETDRLLNEGIIHFTGRFPKAGLYRAFTQFKRGGEIKTLSFTLDVGQTLVSNTFTSTGLGMLHEVPCQYCKLMVVQNTDTQDNEVVLQFGNKRIEYRCVYCAIADSTRYKVDITIYAPSEKVGEPVIILRRDGKWSTRSEEAVFINMFKEHPQCAELSRAFHTKEAFDAYVAKHEIEDPKALKLDQLVEAILKPKDGK